MWTKRTLRFRQDLQFIDSRGSLVKRRVGNLSMPTWGRDMAADWALIGKRCTTGWCSRTEIDMPETVGNVSGIVSAFVGPCQLRGNWKLRVKWAIVRRCRAHADTVGEFEALPAAVVYSKG